MRKDKLSLEERKQIAIHLLEFGAYLNELRKERNLTLQQVADELEVSANWISELERGRGKNPSDQMVRKVADFFEVDEDQLFDILGRVSLRIKEIIESDPNIKETIKYIHSMNIKDDLKEELHKEVMNTVNEFYKKHTRKE